MKLLKFLPFLAILAIASCKKDDDDSNKELLTQDKGWVLTALTVDPAFVDPFSGTFITDFYAQLEACQKDDIIFFKTDNTTVEDEGATKCDPADPQTLTGAWVLSADENVITYTDSESETFSYTIEELNKSTMKVHYIQNFGVNYTFTATFKKGS